MDLQLSELIGAQYAFHGLVVGGVLLFALLVYVFGFKSAVEPPFDKLTNPHEDRKANGKKKKPKEKKTQSNGHIASLGEAKKDVKAPVKKDVEKSPVKEKSKPEKKTALKENRDAKPAPPTPSDPKKKGKGKENVEVKNNNKKNKQADEKPKDFDDGEWEQAPSRKDKKKKTTADETSPSKSDKKKELRKKKEDIKEVEEIVTPPVEEPIKVVAEPIEDIVAPKPEISVESDTEQTEPKEQRKKNRKKKGSVGNETSDPVVEEAPKPVAPPPAPQGKQKKETVVEPIAAPQPEKIETPVIESTVVFDELGDTWKEARAPKKGGKKKSRKE